MRGAGMLRHRLIFQSKGPALDELGNPAPGGSVWTTRFSVRAGMAPRIGGEAVIAGRLQGRQPYIVTVRSSENTRQITPEWRAVDDREGFKPNGDPVRSFAVRSLADPDGKRQWIEILVEEGVAA